GFPLANFLFLVAGVLELIVAAAGVRRFAGGLRAFESLRGLVAYIVVVVLAPFISALVSAFCSPPNYWFDCRVWFLSETLTYLTLAPTILIAFARTRDRLTSLSRARSLEAALLAVGLLAVGMVVFLGPTTWEDQFPALLYLPLPVLLWAAVRFGPIGV